MIKIVGIAQKGKEVLLYYTYTKGNKNYFKATYSHDGIKFDGASKYITLFDEKNKEDTKYDIKNMHVVNMKDNYFLTYQTTSKKQTQLNGAVSDDLVRFKKTGKIPAITEVAGIIPDYKYRNRYVMYFGESNINIAFSGDLKNWKQEHNVLLEPRKDHWDNADLQVAGVLKDDIHVLLVYYVKTKVAHGHLFKVGACLFDKRDPINPIWRSDKPLWEHPDTMRHKTLTPLGIAGISEHLFLYWLVGESNVYAVTCQMPKNYGGLKDKLFTPHLKRAEANPILKPNPENSWESRAAFNTAALEDNGKVHFLYRALGDTDLSVLGYATSSDGITIDTRSKEPIYIPREPFESPGQRQYRSLAEHYVSGGGYGGVEDPRITRVEDKIYLTYVAFNGATHPRAAMSSIDVEDFRKKNWDSWAKPKLISAPGMVNKSAVILPEKVDGKYVVMHRVYPNILVDFLDDLEFDNYLTGQYFIAPRAGHWDSKKIGAGAPPMKTKDGWLLIYQSVGYQDSGRYKIGAMMLDINNPTKVLYRTRQPLIAPDMHYENAGHKSGVVYPCGAVIKDNNLFVYYGGADTVVCAASQNLDTFLDQMKYNQEPTMHRVSSPVFN